MQYPSNFNLKHALALEIGEPAKLVAQSIEMNYKWLRRSGQNNGNNNDG
jgi:hypothetical protein